MSKKKLVELYVEEQEPFVYGCSSNPVTAVGGQKAMEKYGAWKQTTDYM